MTTLLLIDVQKDFHPGGSLAIPTANEDAERIAQLIRQNATKIDRVVATLDSHLKLHIAHPGFWVSGQDKNVHPDPFTIISSQDVVDGKWVPRGDFTLRPSDIVDGLVFERKDSLLNESGDSIDLKKYCIEYTKRLEQKGRFQLCIWPEHCLIGSNGHCVVDVVRQALDEWSIQTGRSVEWILKGQHLLTEMYSAIEAEVPVSTAETYNESLVNSLQQSKQLVVCGQAMSHCVNYTLRDIVDRWPKERVSDIYLLTDCASAVPGFEAAAETFQKDMKEAGVELKKATEMF
jgi:nicotinamidase/pyrazinamidase